MYNPQIETLIQVADAGSFSKAAERMYITSVSIMNQINALEKQIGVKLFERTNQGVELTEADRSIYRDAKQMISDSDAAIERARQIAGVEQLVIRIGTSILRPCKRLIDLWAKADDGSNRFQIKIVPFEDDPANMSAMMKSLGREIDCFVSPCDSAAWRKSYSIHPIGTCKCSIAVSRRHRLAKKECLCWEDMAGETLMLIKRGESPTLDQMRDEIEREHPDIRIVDLPNFYDKNPVGIGGYIAMKEERILRVLGEVAETYIGEAAPGEIQRRKPVLRKLIIIAACLGLLLTLGCAAVAVSPEVRAAVQSVIEILFPPKEVTVTPEGLPESVPHVAQGQDPAEDAPGFSIYVDESRYEMTEENGAFFIRPQKSPLSREDVRQNNSALLEGLTVEEQEAFIDDRLAEQEAFYAALPPCEMEIHELEGTDIEAAAAAARTEMTQAWETVTEIENEDFRLSFFASDGTAWDAPRENHYFYPNGERRVYHIIIRYYSEAEEGHGTRFRTMLETFSVIDPTSITQPQVHTATKSMEPDTDARNVYAAALRNLLYSNILPDGKQAEMPAGTSSQFAVADVDADGKEELVLLYDPGVVAGAVGYIIGYDAETGNIYIQLEEFPFFSFLENGNLKALSSHNQTYGEMWPYILYQYLPESDSYKLAGYVHAEDKAAFEANGVPERYPDAADFSDTGTVYYVGSDAWGTDPIDEADYTAWLEENHGNTSELKMEYLLLTEENILTCEPNRDSENRT